MSSVKRKVRKLERHRAKAKVKSIPEIQGKGKAEARAACEVNLRTALALKKESGKAVREFEALSVDQLKDKLSEVRKELFNLRFKHATGQLERVSDLSVYRRQVARILTLIKQKEVGA